MAENQNSTEIRKTNRNRKRAPWVVWLRPACIETAEGDVLYGHTTRLTRHAIGIRTIGFLEKNQVVRIYVCVGSRWQVIMGKVAVFKQHTSENFPLTAEAGIEFKDASQGTILWQLGKQQNLSAMG